MFIDKNILSCRSKGEPKDFFLLFFIFQVEKINFITDKNLLRLQRSRWRSYSSNGFVKIFQEKNYLKLICVSTTCMRAQRKLSKNGQRYIGTTASISIRFSNEIRNEMIATKQKIHDYIVDYNLQMLRCWCFDMRWSNGRSEFFNINFQCASNRVEVLACSGGATGMSL